MEENLQQRLSRVAQQRKAREEEASELSLREASRKRLLRILQKKITTSFIGAIAKVETYIGTKLWGHGLDESECTREQLLWREVWEQCRNEILNNGNNQTRAVEKEILQYSITWNRYQAVLPAADER